MSRRYVSDPDGLAAALAGRVDRLETDVRRTSDDLTALGRGVGQLTAQIRGLTTATGNDPGTSGGDTDPVPDEAEAESQPDWMGIEDVELAREWLTDLQSWLTYVARHHGLILSAPCWPLHPDVVALLLALQYERSAAYEGERPTPVTEWLTRWFPATSSAIETALSGCVAERGHRHAGHIYDTTDLDLAAVAAWWALDRHELPAVQALGLTRLA